MMMCKPALRTELQCVHNCQAYCLSQEVAQDTKCRNCYSMLSHFPKLKKVTSLQDMRNFGLSVAKETLTKLTKMDGNRNALFLLSGDAGVGKTSFAQAFIGACIQASSPTPHVNYNESINGSDGYLPTIPSPTFCLINEYWCDALKIPINHMDLYRLENPTKETLGTISIPEY